MTFIYCQQFFRAGVSSGSISSTTLGLQQHISTITSITLSCGREQWQHHSWAYCSSAGSPLQLLAQTGKEHPWQELRPQGISWLCSKCLPCGTSSAEVLYPLYWGSSNSWHRIQHTIKRLGLVQNCYQFVSSSQFNSSSSPQPVASA